jgi:hypothetical protein
MTRTYEIKPRGSNLGFSMKLYEDGEEMGGGIFSVDDKTTEVEVYNDALAEAEIWISAGLYRHTESEQARPEN